MIVLGFRNGMEIKIYDLIFHASDAPVPEEGYAGSQVK